MLRYPIRHTKSMIRSAARLVVLATLVIPAFAATQTFARRCDSILIRV